MPTSRGYPTRDPLGEETFDAPNHLNALAEAINDDVDGLDLDGAIEDHNLSEFAHDGRFAVASHKHSGPRLWIAGRADVPVAAGATYGSLDVYPSESHVGRFVFLSIQGGKSRYAICDQSLSPAYFRISVWYDNPAPAAETRYVYWIMVNPGQGPDGT